MEIAQIISNAIDEYYKERGKPTPQWKQKRDPDWWIEHLRDLGIDTRNPQGYNTKVNNGAQFSLVERCFWEAEVARSNRVAPTW